MAKELIKIKGKYYLVDDKTGDVFEVILQNKINDPALLKVALLQVIQLKDSKIKNGS
ncbi:MAG: hypothetical protein Ta2F_16090 [Termitinemataceae bacterium]|nr:MAG: hypothetical protein Ta2F_16090 [Termitinemataceae bacterium]